MTKYAQLEVDGQLYVIPEDYLHFKNGDVVVDAVLQNRIKNSELVIIANGETPFLETVGVKAVDIDLPGSKTVPFVLMKIDE